MSSVTWLHLSDWHEGRPEFDRTVVRNALLKDVADRAQIAPELGQLDFIVFTGDIAWSADPSQYRAVDRDFLGPLLASASLRDRRHLFTVPGNHDIDRTAVKELQKQFPITFTDRRALNEALSGWKLGGLMSPFAAYAEFAAPAIEARASATRCPQPGYYAVSRIEVADKRTIGIVGLNSAWASARSVGGGGEVSDYGNLVVGERQVVDALASLEELGGADIVIAAMHHPFSWLAEFDRDLVEERLSRDCNFILQGHQHQPRVTFQQSTLGDVVLVPAGASWDGRYTPNPRYTLSYNFVHLDLARQQGTVFMRRWTDQEDRWGPAEEVGPKGRFVFPMPERKSSTTPLARDARRRGIVRAARRLRRRACESMEVFMKQTVEHHAGLPFVRHEEVHKFVFSPGDPEDFVHRMEADPSVVALAKEGRLTVAPVEVEYFKIDAEVVPPHTSEVGLLRYRVRIGPEAATIGFKVRSLEPIHGTLFVELGRITQRFRLEFQKDGGLHYQMIPLGGFPNTRTVPHELYATEELTIAEVCYPEQGFVCQWYPAPA